MKKLYVICLFMLSAFAFAEEPRPGMLVEAPKSRVFDKQFLAVSAFDYAAAFADARTTRMQIAGPGSHCQELNGIYGAHPGAGRMYGEALAITSGFQVLSALIKRRTPDRKVWMLPMLSDAFAHGIGAAHNATLNCAGTP